MVGERIYRLVKSSGGNFEASLADANVVGGARGEIKCWVCGGNHRRKDCPKKKDLKCEYPGCTQPRGHLTKDCWEDSKNTSRRASWFVPATPQGAETNTVEVLI